MYYVQEGGYNELPPRRRRAGCFSKRSSSSTEQEGSISRAALFKVSVRFFASTTTFRRLSLKLLAFCWASFVPCLSKSRGLNRALPSFEPVLTVRFLNTLSKIVVIFLLDRTQDGTRKWNNKKDQKKAEEYSRKSFEFIFYFCSCLSVSLFNLFYIFLELLVLLPFCPLLALISNTRRFQNKTNMSNTETEWQGNYQISAADQVKKSQFFSIFRYNFWHK